MSAGGQLAQHILFSYNILYKIIYITKKYYIFLFFTSIHFGYISSRKNVKLTLVSSKIHKNIFVSLFIPKSSVMYK